MEDQKVFETALMEKLELKAVDKTDLKAISAEISVLKKNGLIIDQILVKGKPRVDRYIINGIVDPDFWGKFGKFGGQFSHFEVFPYGIIAPTKFRFNATIEK